MEHTSRSLANWIVRLNAKGEALKASRGSEGDSLRRVALVTCAKSVAEVQLFRQQRARTRSGSGCSGSSGNGIGRSNRLKRLHSSSFSSSDGTSGSVATSAVSGGAAGACQHDGSGSGLAGGGSCSCDSCSLCSTYQAAGANSCYCRALGYAGGAAAAGCKPKSNLLSDDEESRLIDDFLTSLDGVPSSKKCKRL